MFLENQSKDISVGFFFNNQNFHERFFEVPLVFLRAEQKKVFSCQNLLVVKLLYFSISVKLYRKCFCPSFMLLPAGKILLVYIISCTKKYCELIKAVAEILSP